MSKKVFISYAWGDKAHQEWVSYLGTRLMDNTIDVELDQWSLKDGHDIHEFMESMVKADDIFRVLVICDKNYKSKADNRNGGVGTETQIITPAIYSDQKQEKFIPIVIERDEDGRAYLPIYLASRKYIDFSNTDDFEKSYEELLRNIMEAPALPKPKLGTSLPLYITQSPTNDSDLNSIVRVLDNQLKKTPEKVNSYFSDFLEKFLEKLKDFDFKPTSRDYTAYGDELLQNLLSYKVIRNDFIDCLLIVTKEEYKLDAETIISFFEKYLIYCQSTSNMNEGWSPSNTDNYKIIFHELFIYTVAISLKNKNYTLTSDLLHSKYYVANSYRGEKEKRFTFFYTWHENLEKYNEIKYKRQAAFGQYIVSNLNEKLSKEDIILADIICYYIGDAFSLGDITDTWFPTTYVFRNPYDDKMDFFSKLSSLRHFDKTKVVFDVRTVNEFKELLQKYKESKEGKKNDYSYSFRDRIQFLHEIIDIENIGKNR